MGRKGQRRYKTNLLPTPQKHFTCAIRIEKILVMRASSTWCWFSDAESFALFFNFKPGRYVCFKEFKKNMLIGRLIFS
jgi:hypothetical protein